MTLKDILDLAHYRCDEDAEDTSDPAMESVFLNAINQGYCFIATKLDKKTKVVTINYSEKLTLPTDFYSLVEIKHSTYGILSKTDYDIMGDLLIPKVGDVTIGTFTLTYILIPSFILSTSTDSILGLKDMYCTALASYAAYSYMLSQKQYNSATMFLNEFNTLLNNKEVVKIEA